MRDGSSAPNPASLGPLTCAGDLEAAAGAIARLDHALDAHPLAPAFLYRARLEAVRRQAAADGAARTAFGLHQWITTPDFDKEGAVQTAERHLAASPSSSRLLTAAVQVRRWLETGGTRPPIRAALIRFWTT